MSYNKAILGIDCNGKYVTVCHDGSKPLIVPYSLDELINVGGIWFHDSFVKFDSRTNIANRMCKSLLVSFENDLALFNNATIEEFKNNDDGSCDVLLEVEIRGISYNEYLEKGINSADIKGDVLSVTLKEEEWVSCIGLLEEVI